MNSFANTIIINNQQSTNGNSRHRITSCGKDDDSSCDNKPNKLVFPWKYLSADQLANSSGNCNNSDKFHHESVEEKDNIHWLTADRVIFYKNTGNRGVTMDIAVGIEIYYHYFETGTDCNKLVLFIHNPHHPDLLAAKQVLCPITELEGFQKLYLLDGPLLVIGYRNYFEIRSFRNSDEFCKPFKFYYQDIITNSNGNDQQSFTVEEISGLVRGCCRSDFDKWFYILSIEIRIANSFSSNATATCYTFHYSFNSAAFLDRLTSQPIDALTNASPLIRNSTSFPISAVTYLKASEEIRGFPWISEAVRGVYNNCYTTQSGISGGGISGSGGKCRGILDEALDSKVLQIYAIQNHDKGVVVDTTIRVGYLANSEYFHFLYPIGVTNVNVYSRILPVTSPITKMSIRTCSSSPDCMSNGILLIQTALDVLVLDLFTMTVQHEIHNAEYLLSLQDISTPFTIQMLLVPTDDGILLSTTRCSAKSGGMTTANDLSARSDLSLLVFKISINTVKNLQLHRYFQYNAASGIVEHTMPCQIKSSRCFDINSITRKVKESIVNSNIGGNSKQIKRCTNDLYWTESCISINEVSKIDDDKEEKIASNVKEKLEKIKHRQHLLAQNYLRKLKEQKKCDQATLAALKYAFKKLPNIITANSVTVLDTSKLQKLADRFIPYAVVRNHQKRGITLERDSTKTLLSDIRNSFADGENSMEMSTSHDDNCLGSTLNALETLRILYELTPTHNTVIIKTCVKNRGNYPVFDIHLATGLTQDSIDSYADNINTNQEPFKVFSGVIPSLKPGKAAWIETIVEFSQNFVRSYWKLFIGKGSSKSVEFSAYRNIFLAVIVHYNTKMMSFQNEQSIFSQSRCSPNSSTNSDEMQEDKFGINNMNSSTQVCIGAGIVVLYAYDIVDQWLSQSPFFYSRTTALSASAAHTSTIENERKLQRVRDSAFHRAQYRSVVIAEYIECLEMLFGDKYKNSVYVHSSDSGVSGMGSTEVNAANIIPDKSDSSYWEEVPSFNGVPTLYFTFCLRAHFDQICSKHSETVSDSRSDGQSEIGIDSFQSEETGSIFSLDSICEVLQNKFKDTVTIEQSDNNSDSICNSDSHNDNKLFRSGFITIKNNLSIRNYSEILEDIAASIRYILPPEIAIRFSFCSNREYLDSINNLSAKVCDEIILIGRFLHRQHLNNDEGGSDNSISIQNVAAIDRRRGKLRKNNDKQPFPVDCGITVEGFVDHYTEISGESGGRLRKANGNDRIEVAVGHGQKLLLESEEELKLLQMIQQDTDLAYQQAKGHCSEFC